MNSKTKKTIHSSMSTRNHLASSTGKLQDGFTVLLMTETKFGILLTLENNTNPFDLLGELSFMSGKLDEQGS